MATGLKKHPARKQTPAPAPSAHVLCDCRPLGDRVIIQMDKKAEHSPGGIIVVSRDESKEQKGTIIAVGPGRYDNGARVPLEVKIGDRVIVARYAGAGVDDPMADRSQAAYLILREDDILAVIEKR